MRSTWRTTSACRTQNRMPRRTPGVVRPPSADHPSCACFCAMSATSFGTVFFFVAKQTRRPFFLHEHSTKTTRPPFSQRTRKHAGFFSVAHPVGSARSGFRRCGSRLADDPGPRTSWRELRNTCALGYSRSVFRSCITQSFHHSLRGSWLHIPKRTTPNPPPCTACVPSCA